MARKGSYLVTANLLAVVSETTAEVVMSNGHRLLAHMAKNLEIEIKDLLQGQEIVLEVTTHDLSKGCVVALGGRE